MIEDICDNCYLCNSLKKLPAEIPKFSPSGPPKHPGTHWSADVMKYGKKNILVATDNLSSFTTAKISAGERAEQLEEAILLAILPFRSKATSATVRVDTAPGLAKLQRTEKLERDGIKLDPGHVKNPNSCAKVDKIMSELRRELKILNPEEKLLTPANLARAVDNLNCRTRFLGLSSREIMFQRDQQTDENITLSDSSIQAETCINRDKNRNYAAKSQASNNAKEPSHPKFQIGDLVHIKDEKSKGSARELYIVMKNTEPEHLKIKKLLHAFGNDQTSLRHQEYTIAKNRVYPAPNQRPYSNPISSSTKPNPTFKPSPRRNEAPKKPLWFPVNKSQSFRPIKKTPTKNLPQTIAWESEDEDPDPDNPVIEEEDLVVGDDEDGGPLAPATENDFGILDLSFLSLSSIQSSRFSTHTEDNNFVIQEEDLNYERSEHSDEQEDQYNDVVRGEGEDNSEKSTENGILDERVSKQENLDQHRQPKIHDIIIAFSEENQSWYQITLTSNRVRGYPCYYHCTFPNGSQGGIHLIPGQRWSFQHYREEFNEEEATLDNQEHAIENLRALESSDDETPFITPATSVQEFGVQTSFTSDESSEPFESPYIDEEFDDQENITINYETIENTKFIAQEVNDEMSAVHYDLEAPIPIPPDLIVDSRRRYELIQHLNLDVPADGVLVPGHVYKLPDDIYEDFQHNPVNVETASLSGSRKSRIPKFLRKLNPFKKRN